LKIETKNVTSYTADSKPVKQEVNGTVILPLLVFPGYAHKMLMKLTPGWAAAVSAAGW